MLAVKFHLTCLTLSLPNLAKGKFRPDFQISFCTILDNKWRHVRVQAESFHLNGHIIGIRPHTQKLESPYKTLPNTLAVKGLRRTDLETEEAMLACVIYTSLSLLFVFCCRCFIVLLSLMMSCFLSSSRKSYKDIHPQNCLMSFSGRF